MNDPITAINPLLAPIKDDNPVGGDAYALISELEALAKGTEREKVVDGRAVSVREDPNWSDLRRRAEEILNKHSKHLRAAMIHSLASMQLEGWTGLQKGLELVTQLLERYWDTLHPQLPSDGDPYERANILNDLSLPVNTYLDPYNFVFRLRRLKITASPKFGAWSHLELEAARDPVAASLLDPGVVPPNLDQIAAAWQETPARALETLQQALTGVQDARNRITALFQAKAPNRTQPDLKLLATTVGAVLDLVRKARGLGAGPAGPQSAEGAGRDAPALSESPAGSVSGPLGSRAQALRALEAVRDYFLRTEPSSPIPLLINLALDVSQQNFVQILKRLPPSALEELDRVFRLPGADSGASEKKK